MSPGGLISRVGTSSNACKKMFITGQVYLVRSLDRDTQPQWDVNVLAYDEPGTPTNRIGYAIVSVFPKDINDNYPIFREDSLTGTVGENLNPGMRNS